MAKSADKKRVYYKGYIIGDCEGKTLHFPIGEMRGSDYCVEFATRANLIAYIEYTVRDFKRKPHKYGFDNIRGTEIMKVTCESDVAMEISPIVPDVKGGKPKPDTEVLKGAFGI